MEIQLISIAAKFFTESIESQLIIELQQVPRAMFRTMGTKSNIVGAIGECKFNFIVILSLHRIR